MKIRFIKEGKVIDSIIGVGSHATELVVISSGKVVELSIFSLTPSGVLKIRDDISWEIDHEF